MEARERVWKRARHVLVNSCTTDNPCCLDPYFPALILRHSHMLRKLVGHVASSPASSLVFRRIIWTSIQAVEQRPEAGTHFHISIPCCASHSLPGRLLAGKDEDNTIGLASDDVTKLSKAWQRGKLVLNKGSVPYKSMLGEKSLTCRSSLVLRREVRTVLTTPSLFSASHLKRHWGSDKCGAVFRSIDDLPACFCMGRNLCLEPILPVAMPVAGLWRSTCKPYIGTLWCGERPFTGSWAVVFTFFKLLDPLEEIGRWAVAEKSVILWNWSGLTGWSPIQTLWTCIGWQWDRGRSLEPCELLLDMSPTVGLVIALIDLCKEQSGEVAKCILIELWFTSSSARWTCLSFIFIWNGKAEAHSSGKK